MKGLKPSHSASDWEDKTVPLWLRTQRRLARMETWSAQQRNTSDGFDERIQLQDQRIALACRHLVLLLKEMEERGSNRTRVDTTLRLPS